LLHLTDQLLLAKLRGLKSIVAVEYGENGVQRRALEILVEGDLKKGKVSIGLR